MIASFSLTKYSAFVSVMNICTISEFVREKKNPSKSWLPLSLPLISFFLLILSFLLYLSLLVSLSHTPLPPGLIWVIKSLLLFLILSLRSELNLLVVEYIILHFSLVSRILTRTFSLLCLQVSLLKCCLLIVAQCQWLAQCQASLAMRDILVSWLYEI